MLKLKKMHINTNRLRVSITDGNNELGLAARRLIAERYLELNFIPAYSIEDNGIIKEEEDGMHKRSTYFILYNQNSNEVLAVARQINAYMHPNNLPVTTKSKIYKKSLEQIKAYPVDGVVEISMLVKRPGVKRVLLFLLYREMLVHSQKQNHKIWLMALGTNLYPGFKKLFGDVFMEIGPAAKYPGQDIIPLMVHLSAEDAKRNKKRLSWAYRKNYIRGIASNIIWSYYIDSRLRNK